MALDAAKWQIRTDKTIRYIGGAHGTSTANYVTVLELHRWLMDNADNASITDDDYMDITTLNPSDKKFDTIITLINGYTLDDAHTTPASEYIYGGTITQFSQTIRRFGWEAKFVDTEKPGEVSRACTKRTKAIFCESVCNPGGYVTDIPKIAAIAERKGVPLIVDNTSATPYLCRPIEQGATLVVHSTTKYLSGNGTAVGGCLIDSGNFDWSASGKFPSLSEPEPAYHGLKFHETFGPLAFTFHGIAIGLRDLGMAMAPMNAFLTLLGVETLSLRMEKHVANAKIVADWLENDPRVDFVTYAGLKSSPYARRVKKLYPKGAGALFTFAVKGGYDACVKLVDSLEIFSHVANLGDSRSLVIHSASTTHRQLTPEQQETAGAGPNVVRRSIGIEDPDDLIADLDQALAKATA